MSDEKTEVSEESAGNDKSELAQKIDVASLFESEAEEDSTSDKVSDDSGVVAGEEVHPEPSQKEKEKSKPRGYDPVDVHDADPDAIQERIDYLFGQIKQKDRDLEFLGDEHKRLLDRVDTIATDVKSVKDASDGDRMSQLRAEKRTALEDMDYDRAEEIDDQIMDLKLAARQAPVEEEVVEDKPIQKAEDVPPQLVNHIKEWGEATDESGQMLRPYFQTGHPDHDKAVATAIRLSEDPVAQREYYDTDSFLALLDRKMQSARAPSVTPTNSSVRPPVEDDTELSAQERYFARKLGISEDKWKASKQI